MSNTIVLFGPKKINPNALKKLFAQNGELVASKPGNPGLAAEHQPSTILVEQSAGEEPRKVLGFPIFDTDGTHGEKFENQVLVIDDAQKGSLAKEYAKQIREAEKKWKKFADWARLNYKVELGEGSVLLVNETLSSSL